jgi:hypothetical protein
MLEMAIVNLEQSYELHMKQLENEEKDEPCPGASSDNTLNSLSHDRMTPHSSH